MTGLAEKTRLIFNEVAQLTCIKPYALVGGTALAIQIGHRLSEDLDFCRWIPKGSANQAIPYREITEELAQRFDEVEVNPLDFNQVDYLINGEVKLQFFNEVGYHLPEGRLEKTTIGNITLTPVASIGAMKVKTMFQRSAFRDYFDIYVLVKEQHVSFPELIKSSCYYDQKLNSKMIANRLTDYSKFREEQAFKTLSPKYQISNIEIGHFFRELTKLGPGSYQ